MQFLDSVPSAAEKTRLLANPVSYLLDIPVYVEKDFDNFVDYAENFNVINK